MPNRAPTCPNCGSAYEAPQICVVEMKSGRFDCTECGTNVYSWSGEYDYPVWKALEWRYDKRATRAGLA
jgi:hypothetical protein